MGHEARVAVAVCFLSRAVSRADGVDGVVLMCRRTDGTARQQAVDALDAIDAMRPPDGRHRSDGRGKGPLSSSSNNPENLELKFPPQRCKRSAAAFQQRDDLR